MTSTNWRYEITCGGAQVAAGCVLTFQDAIANVYEGLQRQPFLDHYPDGVMPAEFHVVISPLVISTIRPEDN